MDGDARVLIRVLAVLCRDGVLLEGHGLPGMDGAHLEDDGGVAEYEVDGAVDVAFLLELLAVSSVERVLVAIEGAQVIRSAKRRRDGRHSLKTGASCVFKRHELGVEPVSVHSYNTTKQNSF